MVAPLKFFLLPLAIPGREAVDNRDTRMGSRAPAAGVPFPPVNTALAFPPRKGGAACSTEPELAPPLPLLPFSSILLLHPPRESRSLDLPGWWTPLLPSPAAASTLSAASNRLCSALGIAGDVEVVALVK